MNYFLRFSQLAIIFGILLLFHFPSKAQSKFCIFVRRLSNPNIYGTLTKLKAKKAVTINGEIITDTTIYTLQPDTLNHFKSLDYEIINQDESGSALIHILPYASINPKSHIITNEEKEPVKPLNARDYFFRVEKFGFGNKIEKQVHLLAVPILHPFKLRSGVYDENGSYADIAPSLSTDFTIGYSFGVRRRLGKFYRSNYISAIIWGLGIGNTKYFTVDKQDPKVDAAAFTYQNHGILFTFNKVNLGVFAGKDAMIYSQKDWAYQHKWWYSFGLGYQFK